MKQLSTYINEKLVLNKETFKSEYSEYKYNYFPKDRFELKNIIEQLINDRNNRDIIDLNDINISEITDIRDSFADMDIKKIDISKWDVSKVEYMNRMFSHCKNLESVGDLSLWDVSKVRDMTQMFYNCHNLTSVGDISNWKVRNVSDISDMFYGCKNLKNVGNINKWNMSSEFVYMRHAFTESSLYPKWYKE